MPSILSDLVFSEASMELAGSGVTKIMTHVVECSFLIMPFFSNSVKALAHKCCSIVRYSP